MVFVYRITSDHNTVVVEHIIQHIGGGEFSETLIRSKGFMFVHLFF